jgi:hypothetical protein
MYKVVAFTDSFLGNLNPSQTVLAVQLRGGQRPCLNVPDDNPSRTSSPA